MGRSSSCASSGGFAVKKFEDQHPSRAFGRDVTRRLSSPRAADPRARETKRLTSSMTSRTAVIYIVLPDQRRLVEPVAIGGACGGACVNARRLYTDKLQRLFVWRCSWRGHGASSSTSDHICRAVRHQHLCLVCNCTAVGLGPQHYSVICI